MSFIKTYKNKNKKCLKKERNAIGSSRSRKYCAVVGVWMLNILFVYIHEEILKETYVCMCIKTK